MEITSKTNDEDSWFRRNEWIRPLIPSLILILTPTVMAMFPGDSDLTIPGWANVVASVGGCVGLFFGALRARLTDTLSAKLFCAVGVIFGYAVAIWQIVEVIRH